VLDALLLIGVALLVVLNGYFVLSEYALVRSRRGKLEAARDEGSKGAAMAIEQIDEINEYISTAQVGVTFCSIGIGALGEPTIANLLEPVFGNIGGHAVAVTLSALIAYIVITSAHIVIGEIVPKVYAIDRAESVAPRVARALHSFRIFFHPIITVLTAVSDRILRALGVDPDRVAQESSSAEDLKMLIAQSRVGGTLDPGEAVMLSGVFHLHEQEARQVMTPIPAVVTVDTAETVETALRRCIASGHTRLVVTEDGNTDRIKGLVHANSLTRVLMNDGPDATVAAVVKEAPIVPETKPLDDLLADLQRERASMAVVVDEYGRTEGIVTVEDIIEEVVGEISDETDPAGGAVRRLANGDWFVRGHVPITDLVDYGIELEADSEAYNSVGGFVFGELGRLPKRGDMVRENGYSLRVEAVRENRVEAVRIRDHEPESRNGRKRRETEDESVRDGG
jgi:CBS domain containing-hemolysin-like protein